MSGGQPEVSEVVAEELEALPLEEGGEVLLEVEGRRVNFLLLLLVVFLGLFLVSSLLLFWIEIKFYMGKLIMTLIRLLLVLIVFLVLIAFLIVFVVIFVLIAE